MADPLVRWRLVLGKFSSSRLTRALSTEQARMERALDFLYGREYKGRGIWEGGTRQGSLDPTQLAVPNWIREVKKLFPKETVAVIEKHALDKYGLEELVLDKDLLCGLEPNLDLLKVILTFKGRMAPEALSEARRIVRSVVRDLAEQLSSYIRRAFSGRLNRFRKSRYRNAQNFDWKSTLRRNLKHYDPGRHLLIAQDLLFFSRVRKEIPWEIILCVDSSGSMGGSVIHSTVMAGIFAALPALRIKLILFDTSVVDLSGQVDDPVELLFNVQLGGGTNIGGAVGYCETLVRNPLRTILLLITDFCEGAPPHQLYSVIRRLGESGVRLLGLASLDAEVAPVYDEEVAGTLASLGMDICALTPKELVQWLKRTIS
jgi:Mg-chelatase subunit ChlD